MEINTMDPTTVRNEMRKTNQIFEAEVVGKGDFTALKNVYTTNARILPPGSEMVTGREHIQNFWQRAATAMGVKSAKLLTIDAEILDDTVIEIGRAELSTAHPTSPTIVKYVVVWKREDGAWKWHVDIWNAVS
jgi:ketosteroid isomerase-like protein